MGLKGNKRYEFGMATGQVIGGLGLMLAGGGGATLGGAAMVSGFELGRYARVNRMSGYACENVSSALFGDPPETMELYKIVHDKLDPPPRLAGAHFRLAAGHQFTAS